MTLSMSMAERRSNLRSVFAAQLLYACSPVLGMRLQTSVPNSPAQNQHVHLTTQTSMTAAAMPVLRTPMHPRSLLSMPSILRSAPLQMSASSLATADTNTAVPTTARIVFVASASPSAYGRTSPMPQPPWTEVAAHLASRLSNFDSRVLGVAFDEAEVGGADGRCTDAFMDAVRDADMVVALDVRSASAVSAIDFALQNAGSRVSAMVCSDCSEELSAMQFVGDYKVRAGSALEAAAMKLSMSLAPWGGVARGARLHAQAVSLLQRASSEDLVYACFFIIHAYVMPLPLVKHTISPTWEKGLGNLAEFYKMATCCGGPILRAVRDETTKKAIDMLNECDMRDQVGSYRVIVSFETPLLEAFSLCILQKNNCFNCNSEILRTPAVPVLSEWRGAPLTWETASQIFYGHLNIPQAHSAGARRDWSWKVVCGANPAYDAFPAQHQIFYPGKAKGSIWYDPVFKVETVDGRAVWRRRHYRVRRAGGTQKGTSNHEADADAPPGVWMLSTLDNGVISNERWTIVDAADDLSWVVFHYSGAASVVGQSYVGALLCTDTGQRNNAHPKPRPYPNLRAILS
uniref:VDE lipocalin domain-containing protein n=1 Tax=Chrysotila carterae TaxID=13221 RepID=A0A7S4B694_CHRCT